MSNCQRCSLPKEPGRGRKLCNSCRESSICKKCSSQLVLTWRTSKFGKPTPEYKCRKCRVSSEKIRRENDLDDYYLSKVKSKYGLTKDQYFELHASQEGKCKVCGILPTGRGPFRSLNVDHDHVTGKVRGLLCAACNQCLGYSRDNPEILRSLADYLESSRN